MMTRSSGATVLKLRRQGEWYSVWRFLTPPAASSGGTRTSRSPSSSPDVEVNDLQLDLVVDPDGSWHWKDVEALAPALASGRIDDAQPHHVLETVASVPDLLERDERWWSPWDDWTSSA